MNDVDDDDKSHLKKISNTRSSTLPSGFDIRVHRREYY